MKSIKPLSPLSAVNVDKQSRECLSCETSYVVEYNAQEESRL